MNDDRWVCLALGDKVEIEVMRGMREARVLAICLQEALLEYESPAYTALRVVPKWRERGTDPGKPYRRYAYHAVPKRWLLRMALSDTKWKGRGCHGTATDLSPTDYFVGRYPRSARALDLPPIPPEQLQAVRLGGRQ